MTSNLETIDALRVRVRAGDIPSDAELAAGIRAIRAHRRAHPANTLYRRLRSWIREFFYWLWHHKEDEANARLAEAAWAEADLQERVCDDY